MKPDGGDMESCLESIKIDILRELERTGSIDVVKWARNYPHHRDELLDFAYWAELSASISDQGEDVEDADSSQVAEGVLRSWSAILRQEARDAQCNPVGTSSSVQERGNLDREESQGEAAPSGRRRKTPDAFKRAAILAWSVQRIGSGVRPVSRLRVNKSLRLLERRMNLGLFVNFQKMPLGPYDPTLRYKDAEPIARKQGWIVIEGTTIRAGGSIQKGCSYAPPYLGDEGMAEEFLRQVSMFSEAELETLTTVDAVVLELLGEQATVSVETIKQTIYKTGEWQKKLRKRNFSDQAISIALEQLRALQLWR